MRGQRKYRLALASLLSLVIAFGGSAWAKVPADVLHEFVLGLFLLSVAFGSANGVEHVAEAIKARREAKP